MKHEIRISLILITGYVTGAFILHGVMEVIEATRPAATSAIQGIHYALGDLFREIDALGYYILVVMVTSWGGSLICFLTGKHIWAKAMLISAVSITFLILLILMLT